jgi:hypothetical protein
MKLKCVLCEKSLTGRQKKYCSLKHERYVARRKERIKIRESRAKFRLGMKFVLPRVSKRAAYVPNLAKPGKGTTFKLKQVHKYELKEVPFTKEGWKWFWDVKKHIEPLEPNMRQLYKQYEKKWKQGV